MKRVLAALMLIATAAVAIVGNGQFSRFRELPKPAIRMAPGSVRNADRPRGGRHEASSIAAVAALPTVAALDAREIQRVIATAVDGLAALPTFRGQAAPAAIVPDPTLTPGAVRSTNIGEICNEGSTRSLRYWSRERDDFIMRGYGLPGGAHPDFEIDHLIALELGGSDDDRNLWPEPRRSIEPVWNAERKDRLENRLRDLVCSGALDVVEAQKTIAEDWTAAYGRFVGAMK